MPYSCSPLIPIATMRAGPAEAVRRCGRYSMQFNDRMFWFGEGVGNYGPDYALRAYAAYAQPGIG